MPDFHPSTVSAVRELVERFPGTPFLTLGQTVLWDEPLKAAFCRILEAVAPTATMVAAVHDTDYFAKLTHFENRAEKFVLLPHNDGDTRGLWSAAGELSCLFGSETVPSRPLLTENGVAFDRVARHYPGGAGALLNQETEAWGWRALVHTEPHPLIAADVRLRDIAPALRQQLEWGFHESLRALGCDAEAPYANDANPCESRDIARRIVAWVDEYVATDPDGTLSDLYRWLTPLLWQLVRGEGSCPLDTSASLELFLFNQATASRPRFRFAELFLDPATRDLARSSYDDAVRGSGIYTLDQFGDGALPFDVVIPGRGRGTLRLHEGSLYIETEQPITLCTGCDCGSLSDLAGALQSQFGENVALVGKAVALISMLSSEFIFVFHEKASSYTSRTHQMNEAIRAGGAELRLHPMLRLKHATWDALDAVDATFHLPPHLATAFAAPTVSARDFAARWHDVADAADQLRGELKACASPRDLLTLLAKQQGNGWNGQLADYQAARAAIAALRERTLVLEKQATQLRTQATETKVRTEALEREKGDNFRSTVQPLRERLFDLKEGAAARVAAVDENGKPVKLTKEQRQEQALLQAEEEREIEALRAAIAEREVERGHFDAELKALRQSAREAQEQAKRFITERVEIERSEAMMAARATISRVEYEAELERLRATRDAITVSSGLRYTNYRPTAWWLALVSPDGAWFNRIAETAQARVEEL